MDIARAHKRCVATSSTHGHRRLGAGTARIDPGGPSACDETGADYESGDELSGLELEMFGSLGPRQSPFDDEVAPLTPERRNGRQSPWGGRRSRSPPYDVDGRDSDDGGIGLEFMGPDEMKPLSPKKDESNKPPRYGPGRLGGFIASRNYAQRAISRESHKEKLRLAAATPKAVEAALKEQRERARRRKRVKTICPNPVSSARHFLANPVTRFWLGCNLCFTICIFVGSFLFMNILYPIFFRRILKY